MRASHFSSAYSFCLRACGKDQVRMRAWCRITAIKLPTNGNCSRTQSPQPQATKHVNVPFISNSASLTFGCGLRVIRHRWDRLMFHIYDVRARLNLHPAISMFEDVQVPRGRGLCRVSCGLTAGRHPKWYTLHTRMFQVELLKISSAC